MSQPVGNKPSMKGACWGHVTNFKTLLALIISRMAKGRVVKF